MKRMLKLFFLIGIAFSIVGCSSSMAIDDFFGIKMPLNEANYFKIVAYTELSGISYQSTPNMNPNIFAWAKLEGDKLRIKLVNNSDSEIPLSYNSDQFIIVTKDNKEFICLNGNIITYNNLSPLLTNSSAELLLEIPQNFWETVGMKNYQSANTSYTQDFWKGQNTLVIDKGEIKHICINLGFSTNILLKQVKKTE